MSLEIRPMTLAEYDEVIRLWSGQPGVVIRDADTREGIAYFLDRNPGLSLVAREAGVLVGAILCGHDGRRGYLHHLVVSPACRKKGLGRALAEECLDRLLKLGIRKSHLFVMKDNHPALAFWQTIGWKKREDIDICSITRGDSANA